MLSGLLLIHHQEGGWVRHIHDVKLSGLLGIISKLNDAKKDEIISSLSQPPLPPQKTKKTYTFGIIFYLV